MRGVEAGRAGADGRAAARRPGGLRHQQGSTDRTLRLAGGRAGGRPDKAGQAAVQHPRGKPGRVLPQDAAGHGPRRPGHPRQAGRPDPQHAHPGRRAAQQMGPHRLRNPGNLRAHCLPAGPEPDVPRITGPVFPASASLALCRAEQGPGTRARAPPRSGGQGQQGSRNRLRGHPHAGAHLRTREDALFHLPQDGREAPELRANHRHVWLPADRAYAGRLLHRPGHVAPALQAGARQVQGSHCHPQAKRLPVAAHHAGRPLGRERRIPDPHRGHARGGGIRGGGALAVQGQRTRQSDRRAPGCAVAAVPAGHPERDARRRRVLGPRQGRPLPRRRVRLHAQEQDHGAAAGRHSGRLRLRNPQRHRRPHHGRAHQRSAGAIAHRAQERRCCGGGHGAGVRTQSGLAELRAHRPGTLQDPPPSQDHGADRVRGSGRKTAAAGAARRRHRTLPHRR